MSSGHIADRPDVPIHPGAYVDAPWEIGAGTKIWRFSRMQLGARIGNGCILRQGER